MHPRVLMECLFQCDQISYSLVPVTGWSNLEAAFQQHREQFSLFLFLNCGVTGDLVDNLRPDHHHRFFVVDSRRPIHLVNAFATQVREKTLRDDIQLPDYDEIFREDEEQWDGGEEVMDEDEQKEKETTDEVRTHSALLLFELAWTLSKDSNEMLWWAKKIPQGKYVSDIAWLQRHVSRLNHRQEEGAGGSHSHDSLRLAFTYELSLSLYQHWSLLDSLTHSLPTWAGLKLWSLAGQRRLQGLLADTGIPLREARQTFSAMDLELKTNLQQLFDKTLNFQGKCLLSGSFDLGVFTTNCGEDYFIFLTVCFLSLWDFLCRGGVAKLMEGIERAKLWLECVHRVVASCIATAQLTSLGPFLFCTLSQGMPDVGVFCHPDRLRVLSLHLLHSHVHSTKNRRSRQLPLLVSVPLEKLISSSLCCSFFGRAFEKAAETTASHIICDNFNSAGKVSLIGKKNI
uniref:Cell division cycle 45 n=1 Tax=Eptatretus burgeri TaxID=7764 RepID=A0A8C4NF56_EPTBU